MVPRCVLLDFLAVTTGGQVTRAQAFLERIRRYDPDSRIIVLQGLDNCPTCTQRLNLEVVDVRFTPGRYRAIRRMIWQNLRLPVLMKRLGVDVYISFSHYLPRTMSGGVLSIIGVSNSAPFSGLAWDAEVSLWGKLRLAALKRTILSSARRARRVVALSATLRTVLVELGIDERKISLIPNGVELRPDNGTGLGPPHVLKRYGVPSSYLLYVSHFYRYKNFARLVQAYAALPRDLRERYLLVLVGEPHDKEYFREILYQIDCLDLRRQVVVVPGLPKEELAAFYSQASLFIFPSLVENSPNILLEAMACGAPVLASQIDPMPEFGQDVVRYFDPLSVDSLAKEMAAMLLDPATLQAMRERARARAARFSWDNFTAGVVSLYSSP